jgi:hypothetical protein
LISLRQDGQLLDEKIDSQPDSTRTHSQSKTICRTLQQRTPHPQPGYMRPKKSQEPKSSGAYEGFAPRQTGRAFETSWQDGDDQRGVKTV